MAETRHSTTIDIKVDDREIVRLGQEIERTFTTRALDAFTQGMERQSKAFDTLIKQQTKLLGLIEKTSKAKKEGHEEEGGGHKQQHMGFGAHTAAHYLGHKLAHVPNLPGEALRGEAVGSILHLLPGGGAAAGAVAGGQKYFQMAVAAAQSRMGGFGKSGLGKEAQDALMQSIGVPMGIEPMQIPGMLANVAQQTGLSGGALAGVSGSVIAAQRFGGIDAAGSVIGAAGAAGGKVSPERATALLKDTIGSALEAGIQEARLDQYFQGVSGFVEQMRNRGVLIEPESVNALVRGFSTAQAESFRGMAGLIVAQQMGNNLARGMEGRGMLSARLMRATGVSSGERGYFKAMEMLEQDPLQFVPSLVRQIQSQGGGRDSQLLGALLRSDLGEAGIQLSYKQAREMMEMSPDQLDAQFGRDAAGRTVRRGGSYIGGRMGATESMMMPLRTEAKLKYDEQRIGEDARIGKMVETIHHADVEAVKAILPAVAGFIEKVVHWGADRVKGAAEFFNETGRGHDGPRSKVSQPLVPGQGYADPVTGLPAIPDFERDEFDANVGAFGRAAAWKMQVQKNQNRKKIALERIKAGKAKRFLDGGDPLGMIEKSEWGYEKPIVHEERARAAGHGRMPADLATDAATPKRAMDSAALHLRKAADLLNNASEGYDMVFSLSESEATGGN